MLHVILFLKFTPSSSLGASCAIDGRHIAVTNPTEKIWNGDSWETRGLIHLWTLRSSSSSPGIQHTVQHTLQRTLQYTHCNAHCNTCCITCCNTHCNAHFDLPLPRLVYNTHCSTHCSAHCSAHCNTHCNAHCNAHCNTCCNAHCNTLCNTHSNRVQRMLQVLALLARRGRSKCALQCASSPSLLHDEVHCNAHFDLPLRTLQRTLRSSSSSPSLLYVHPCCVLLCVYCILCVAACIIVCCCACVCRFGGDTYRVAKTHRMP